MAGPGYQKILTKIGNRAGSIVGFGTGVGQLISSNRAKKAAVASTPAAIDPTQSAFLVELQQKKNALNTGSQYSSAIDSVLDNMAQTQDTLAENSGGDSSGLISGLLKTQQVANRGVGDVLAQGQQDQNFNTGLYGNLLDKITQRKLELGLLSRSQNMAEWAQKQQTGMSNVTAGAQSLMDFKGSDQKAFSPAIAGGSTAEVPGGTGAGAQMAGGGSSGGGGGGMVGGLLNIFGSKGSAAPGGGTSGGTGGGFDAGKFMDIFKSMGK